MGFYDLFPERKGKPVIGMIHLAGGRCNKLDRVNRELSIFEQEKVHGVIFEDYHGSVEDVKSALEFVSRRGTSLTVGVNILRDPYMAFEFASRFKKGFVQFDNVQALVLDVTRYEEMRKKYPHVTVFGGIRFKYQPKTGKSLEENLSEGMQRCDAIVTIGEETGIETPVEKLRDFKRLMGDFPLIVGAGINKDNVYEQMSIADGAIAGSFFKNNKIENYVDQIRVAELMDALR